MPLINNQAWTVFCQVGFAAGRARGRKWQSLFGSFSSEKELLA
jgi:hypothetical protein